MQAAASSEAIRRRGGTASGWQTLETMHVEPAPGERQRLAKRFAAVPQDSQTGCVHFEGESRVNYIYTGIKVMFTADDGDRIGRTCTSHRVAWEIAHNCILKSCDKLVHVCQNPLCIRPNHMRIKHMHSKRAGDADAEQRPPKQPRCVCPCAAKLKKLKARVAEIEAAIAIGPDPGYKLLP